MYPVARSEDPTSFRSRRARYRTHEAVAQEPATPARKFGLVDASVAIVIRSLRKGLIRRIGKGIVRPFVDPTCRALPVRFHSEPSECFQDNRILVCTVECN